jgi:ketosteroid isomerase-like protein
MQRDPITHNLDSVDRHFTLETTDIEAAIDLYTEDVAWEWPSRRIALRGKSAVAENYRRMFASMADFTVETHERFATADRVVDDATVRFTRMDGGGAGTPGAPAGVRVAMRLLHVFHMRDGKIARELVFDAAA